MISAFIRTSAFIVVSVQHLKELQNFNTCLAVIGGISHSALARLSKTMMCLSSEDIKVRRYPGQTDHKVDACHPCAFSCSVNWRISCLRTRTMRNTEKACRNAKASRFPLCKDQCFSLELKWMTIGVFLVVYISRILFRFTLHYKIVSNTIWSIFVNSCNWVWSFAHWPICS